MTSNRLVNTWRWSVFKRRCRLDLYDTSSLWCQSLTFILPRKYIPYDYYGLCVNYICHYKMIINILCKYTHIYSIWYLRVDPKQSFHTFSVGICWNRTCFVAVLVGALVNRCFARSSCWKYSFLLAILAGALVYRCFVRGSCWLCVFFNLNTMA